MECSGIAVGCNHLFCNFFSFSAHKSFPQRALSPSQIFKYGTYIEIVLFR